MERIVIGSDKSGFTLKEHLVKYLAGLGYAVEDVGTKDIANFQPYFQVAPKAAKKLQDGEADRALLVCGTGAGMCVVANKFPGVHAVAAESVYTGRMASAINRANCLTMGGWVVAPEMAEQIVSAWLTTPFGEGFPPERVTFLSNARNQVTAVEAENFK